MDRLFFQKLLHIGMRTGNNNNILVSDILSSQTMNYLHYGIGKWYYPSLAATIGSIFYIWKYPVILPVLTAIFILFYGYLSNGNTEIWHIIPLYPFLGLNTAFFADRVVFISVKVIRKAWFTYVTTGLLSVGFLLVCFYQIYQFRNSVGLFDHGKSSWAKVASYANGYNLPLYFDADNIFPSLVFYSGKDVRMIHDNYNGQRTLAEMIKAAHNPSLVLTEKWRLETDKINPETYKILKEEDGKVLLMVGNNNYEIK